MGSYLIIVVFPCSKKRKCLECMGEFLKREWSHYENHSDEAPGTDSGDSQDHRVCPLDLNIITCKKIHH